MFKKFAARVANSSSLWLAGISFGLIYGGLFIFFLTKKYFFVAYDVLNPLSIWIAVLVTAIVVFFSFWRQAQVRGDDEIEKKYWLLLAVFVGAAYAFVVGIFSYLFVIVFSTAFRNMVFDFVSAPFLLASYGALIAYFVSESIQHFDRRHFSYLIVIEFLSGFFLAAIKTGDDHWWQGSICSLGMPINKSPLFFNFTLILTGLLLALFAIYLKETINKLIELGYLRKIQARLLAWLYFSLSVALVSLGVFPFGVNDMMNKLHVYIGEAIFGAFAGFLILTLIIFDKFPNRFKVSSYFLLAVGFVFYLLHFQTGYLEYAIMELMMILVMVVWFMIFVRTVTQLLKESEAD